MAKKNERDYTIIGHYQYDYKVSYEDFLEVGDYYIDFALKCKSTQAIQRCLTTKLRDLVNRHFTLTEVANRASAKIIATNDPKLNEQGVPFLHKILP